MEERKINIDPKKEYEKQMRTQKAILEKIPEFEVQMKRIAEVCLDISLIFLDVRNAVDQTIEVTAGVLAGIANEVIGSVCDRMQETLLPILVDLMEKKVKEMKDAGLLLNKGKS